MITELHINFLDWDKIENEIDREKLDLELKLLGSFLYYKGD
jgi:hypothetical protein